MLYYVRENSGLNYSTCTTFLFPYCEGVEEPADGLTNHP